jgi:hypothetical protein
MLQTHHFLDAFNKQKATLSSFLHLVRKLIHLVRKLIHLVRKLIHLVKKLIHLVRQLSFSKEAYSFSKETITLIQNRKKLRIYCSILKGADTFWDP